MADPVEQLRGELRALARRRELLKGEAEKLALETTKAVRRARGVISITEAMGLLGLDRTAAYRTYG